MMKPDSHSALHDPEQALTTYLESLLGCPAAQRFDAGQAFRIQTFQVAGLKLAVPCQRLTDVVPGDYFQLPEIDNSSLILATTYYQASRCRLVNTARLIIPAERLSQIRPATSVDHFILFDEGRWALACDAISPVVEIQHNEVNWRTSAGRRPWLSGTLGADTCALLDVDQIVQQIEKDWHR